jgi:hypothetical protein
LRADFVVHRSGDTGSPRTSGSTSASNADRSPGSSSTSRLRPHPHGAPGPAAHRRPPTRHSPRHGPLGYTCRPGNPPDPAVTQHPRFGAQQQAALSFVQVRQQRPQLRRQPLIGSIHPLISHERPSIWEPAS